MGAIMRPRRVNLLLKVWPVLLALAALNVWVDLALADQATGLTRPAQYQQESGSRGSLQIRLQSEEGAQYPPGYLLLSDPSGRLAGADSRANYNYQEIPSATYSTENITAQQQAVLLYVDNAVSGTYSLRVIGVDSGPYILSMKGYDDAGNHADVRFTASLQPGEVHHYVIQYSNRGGASLKVRRTRAAE